MTIKYGGYAGETDDYLNNCRLYSVKLYEKKSGRHHTFYVLASCKKQAMNMADEYAKSVIGITCIIKKINKLPNTHQVIDFFTE